MPALAALSPVHGNRDMSCVIFHLKTMMSGTNLVS